MDRRKEGPTHTRDVRLFHLTLSLARLDGAAQTIQSNSQCRQLTPPCQHGDELIHLMSDWPIAGFSTFVILISCPAFCNNNHWNLAA